MGDPIPEGGGNLVPALLGDEDLQLGLEVERLEARRTLLEVPLDLQPAIVRQLTVKEVIQGVDGLLTICLSTVPLIQLHQFSTLTLGDRRHQPT